MTKVPTPRFCDFQWDMYRVSVEEDHKRFARVLARIYDDDRTTSGSVLEVGKKGGKKETNEARQPADIGDNNLQIGV